MSEARVLFLLLLMSESCQNAINYKTHRSEIISDSSQGSIKNYKYKYSRIVFCGSRSFSIFIWGVFENIQHIITKKVLSQLFWRLPFLTFIFWNYWKVQSSQVKGTKWFLWWQLRPLFTLQWRVSAPFSLLKQKREDKDKFKLKINIWPIHIVEGP